MIGCGCWLACAPAAAAKEPPKPSAAAVALVKALTAEQRAELLKVLNEGESTTLEAIPSIGPARAAAIIQARPFVEPVDVLRVSGVGEATFAKIIGHAQAGFPAKSTGRKKKQAAQDTPKPSPE